MTDEKSENANPAAKESIKIPAEEDKLGETQSCIEKADLKDEVKEVEETKEDKKQVEVAQEESKEEFMLSDDTMVGEDEWRRLRRGAMQPTYRHERWYLELS